MRRLAAAAVASAVLAFASPCLARPRASGVEAENERRARAGLLPRKGSPPRPGAPAGPPASAGSAPVTAHPPPVPPVAPPQPAPTAGGELPPPRPPPPSSPLDAAVVAGRALAGGDETAPSNVSIDAVPLAVRALTVSSTIRVRSGRVTFVVESSGR